MSEFSTLTYGVGVLIAVANVAMGGYLMTHPSDTSGIVNLLIGIVLLAAIALEVNRHAR